MQNTVKKQLSVVVASHRSAAMRRLASALSSRMPDFVEIVVVADYNTDKLSCEFPKFTWMVLNNKSISAKRNMGCDAASADIVAFIDDDCVPSPDWMELGLAFLNANPNAAGCEGRTVIDKTDAIAPMSEYKRLEQPGYRTNNIFYRKQAINSVGGFDERFTIQREDVDLAYGILEKGHTIAYCPEAIVFHSTRPNEYFDLIKNCINRRFDPLLYKKHKVLYRKHVGCPIPPSIGIILTSHCVSLLVFMFAKPMTEWFFLLEFMVAFSLAWRRNQGRHQYGISLFIDGILFLMAPFFLLGALIHGSVRFKKWLIF